jgi:DNA-binding NtrC family response regulator
LTIFLIEDNPGDLVLTKQILSAALPTVNIRVAMDGEQALRMLGDTDLKPDLVILDLNIPKIPGIALGVREFFKSRSISMSLSASYVGWPRAGQSRRDLDNINSPLAEQDYRQE